MSCATPVDLTISKGATFGPLILTLKDSTNQPVDLTGWSVWAEVRASASGAVAVDLAPIISDAAAGQVTIELADEATGALTAGAYLWDLLAQNDLGEKLGPLVSGAVTITDIITQP